MSKKFNKKAAVTIASSHTLHDVFSSFYAPLIPVLRESLSMSYTLAGLLAVVQKAPALLNPFLGFIADKLIIKWFLIISPMITVISMSLIGIAPSIAALTVVLFVTGISGAVYHTTAPVIMRQISGDKVGTGMSLFMFGGELARTLGPLTVTAAVSFWGLSGIWRLIPIGVTGTVFIYFQLHRIPDIRPSSSQQKKREPVLSAIKKMQPLFIIITPMLLFRSFSRTSLTTFLSSYLVDGGMSFEHANMAFAFLQGFAAAGTLIAGTFSDKLGRKKVLIAIMAATPLLMFGFTFTSGYIQLAVMALMGFVFFASTPVFMAMVHDMNSTYPALANGIYMMVSFAMTSIVSIVIGYLGDTYGLRTTYQITAVLSIGALPFALRIKSPKTNLP